jgi:ATP-dependent DNA helicase RecG
MSPYLFNGRPFRRVASTTSLMPQSEYQRRLLQRDHARERWENQIAIGYRVKDLDATEIRQMVSDSIAAGRLLEQWTERQRRILHALRDGTPRRLGELLAVLDPPPPHQTIRDDLNLLRKLGQVVSFGRGPGARWQLTPPPS